MVESTPSSAKYLTQRAKGESFQLVRTNKKLLQKQISSELGKVVSLKDLSNIHQKQKLNSGINSLEGTVKLLKCTYGEFMARMIHGFEIICKIVRVLFKRT